MRIVLLVPGTGYFFCGSCLRDNAMASAMARLGHDVEVMPLYLPMVLEEHEVEDRGKQKVRMGGINMYLQQKSRMAGSLPGFVANMLDSPGLLRWASRRGNMTEARDLAAMTLSMLQGEQGRQRKEIEKLVASLGKIERPDIVVVSNAMLLGMVRRIRETLDVPIVATLQGEAPFLDALPEPFRGQCWDTLRERAKDVSAFVPVSHYYGDLMRDRLDIAGDRYHVIYNGIDLRGLEPEPPRLADRRPRTIGYLARMCRDKGLHTLIGAFEQLASKPEFADVRLSVLGAQLNEDRKFVAELTSSLESHGLRDRVEFIPNATRSQKHAFLRKLSVLSVPATYGESFGLYLLEAHAGGVPVVQPRHGAFPEVLGETQGGTLCEPDDPGSLAAGLEDLLGDEIRAQQLADTGRANVLARFSSENMAKQFESLCTTVLRPDTRI